MAEACCAKHSTNLSQLKNRAILLLTLGCILLVPAFESVLATGLAGSIFFVCASLLIGQSIRKDFTDEIGYSLTMAVSICLALATPFAQNFYYLAMINPSFFIAQCIVSCFLLLFVRWENIKKLAVFHQATEKQKTPQPKQTNAIFHFPSVDKIMLLFVIVSWTTSLASFIPPFNLLYSNVLHDALLVLGISNISAWIKQRMQSGALAHNHQIQVSVIDRHTNENKLVYLSELKKGMQVTITQDLLLPLACSAIDNCTITHDSAEERVNIKDGTLITANTVIHNGIVECQKDYKKTNHATANDQTEDPDKRMTGMLMIALATAVASGLWHGLTLSSFAVGLQFFCLNLIVSCPCIFLLAKPILNNKFLNWLDNYSPIKFAKMPNCGQPDIIVFDRTHTLYEEDPKNPNGGYIINAKSKNLLRKLKKNGVKCYILSGHGTEKWEEHLADCKKELEGIVDPKNIIFDKKYHHDLRAKEKVIQNLQLYGMVDAPRSQIASWYFTIKNWFTRNHVGMIGDGCNDMYAMQKADFTMGVSRVSNNYNNNILKEANFYVEQKNLWHLEKLLSTLQKTNQYYNFFTNTAIVYNLTMLTLVNGLYFSLFGMAFPATTACLGISIFCVSLLFTASLIKIGPKNSSTQQIHKHTHTCCATPSCNLHTIPQTPPHEIKDMLKNATMCYECNNPPFDLLKKNNLKEACSTVTKLEPNQGKNR